MTTARWTAKSAQAIALPELRGANAAAFDSRARELIISGPAGTGKTRTLLSKAHYYASKYPGARILLLRKTRESMTDSVLVTYERDVLGENHPLTAGARRQFRHSYIYPNGSELVVAGMRQSGKDMTAKVMSTDYDMILVFEAVEFGLEEWEKLITRRRAGVLPFQQLAGDCNPSSPAHWIWSRQLSGKVEFYQSRHADNPRWHDGAALTVAGEDYLAGLDALTGYTRDRLRDGLWVQAEGAVLDTWNDAENVGEAAEYTPDGGIVYWGLDDGYSAGGAIATRGIDSNTGGFVADAHPRAILLCQLRPDGQLAVFQESYACLTLSNVHIRDTLGLPYPRPEFSAHGPGSAEIRGHLREAGIAPWRATSEVEEGIKLLREKLSADSNGWRGIIVHPRCTHLRREMTAYSYDTQGKIVKSFDHGVDGLRYLIWVLKHSRNTT